MSAEELLQEADHLFLGVEPYLRFPILLALALLVEHAFISGATGSAKSSIGLTSLILQLLHARRRRDGSTRRPPPMVILDMKGDPLLFHTVREHVERTSWIEDGRVMRQRFRFFTLNPGYTTATFNPFQSLELGRRSLAQLCDLFLDSLDLNNGRGYGRDYYREMTLTLLRGAIPELAAREARGEGVSLRTLAAIIAARRPKRSEGFELGNFVQLLSRLHGLCEFEQLLTTQPLDSGGADQAIHMPRLLDDNEVAYFWLDSTSQSVTAAGVAHLVLYALITAGATRTHDRAFCAIDEFANVVGLGFAPLLQMARGRSGVSFLLTSQTLSQMKTPDGIDSHEVEANTNVKFFFTTDNDDQEKIGRMSGEELVYLTGTSAVEGVSVTDMPVTECQVGHFAAHYTHGLQSATTSTPSIRPRLGPNDFAAINSDIRRFLVQPRRNEGYTQFGGFPFQVETTWPISPAEFERLGGHDFPQRQDNVWPAPAPGLESRATSPAVADRRMDEAAAEALRTLDERLDSLPPIRPPRGTPRKPSPRGSS